MTRAEVEAVRVKWKQRPDRTPCVHLNLELEWNDLGHSTGDGQVFLHSLR